MAVQLYPENRETLEQRRRRLCRIGGADWSPWKKLIVPEEGLRRNYRDRNAGNEGSYKEINLPGRGVCGIYEWKLVKRRKDIVVYVGSSCSIEGSPLRERILQYCRSGAHKDDLINDALRKGYQMHVRYKEFPNREESRDAENFLLQRYNYAWNVRQNGKREPEGF